MKLKDLLTVLRGEVDLLIFNDDYSLCLRCLSFEIDFDSGLICFQAPNSSDILDVYLDHTVDFVLPFAGGLSNVYLKA